MSISIVVGYDVTHENLGTAPAGQLAGYTTGGSEIAWTAEDWGKHPGAVRICEDAGATDGSADVLDVENGAATFADCPNWAKRALASFEDVTRPGQRKPVIYCSADNVTPVANALINGSIPSGVGLWVADWNLTESEAVSVVMAASGPFGIQGIQYGPRTTYDIDIFDAGWLADVSKVVPPKIPTRHISVGNQSLNGAANKAGVPLEACIWETAINSPGGFGPAQRSYFAAANMNAHMPVGMIYWLAAG